MQRKLASVQKIRAIRPIKGADLIEAVQVNNWWVVSKKGDFQPGDLCIYCEIDALLPIRPQFEFLRKSSYRKLKDGTEGFRLRTVTMRGQVSQGLVLPLSILNGEEEMQVGISKQPWGDQLQLGPYDDALVIEEGVEVTSLLGIIKWDPPIPAEMIGVAKGNFPSFIPKTDEERIQNLTNEYDEMKAAGFYYRSEKLDGASATYYLVDGEFGACSRNTDLLRPGSHYLDEDENDAQASETTQWKIARELDLEDKLADIPFNCAIQGELIGEGIQGNPYKIKGHELRVYTMFNIDKQERVDIFVMLNTLVNLGIPAVPMIPDFYYRLPETIDDILAQADGPSLLNPSTKREGLVIRSLDGKISFKAISNEFLINEKD